MIINNSTPLVQYATRQGDGGTILGTKGEDTRQSLFELLVQKYGDRLDVEKTMIINGMFNDN
jgi:hypothetical protein